MESAKLWQNFVIPGLSQIEHIDRTADSGVEHSICAKVAPTTFVQIKRDIMRYKRAVLGKSDQFFYVHLKFTQEIVVEVPRRLLNQKQSDPVGQGFTEKAIALDLARDVALKTASPFPGERAAGSHYEEDPPIWYEQGHRVMNRKPCDYEERGIRAWKIP